MSQTNCGQFIWYELLTPNASAAAAFYGAVVGWTIPDAADPQAGGQDYRMIGRADGGSAGGVLQLTAEMLAHGARPTWLGYLHVVDVDRTVADIKADGGALLMPPFDLPVGRIAMVADPMGSPFYVMAPIPPPGKPEAKSDVFDPAAPQHVRWNELQSPNLANTKVFYAKHFGFEFRESMPMGPMGDYCFIDLHDVRIGAIMQKPEQTPGGGWLFYFGVASAAAAARAIEAAGGTVLHGPSEVPGGDWIVVATDPHGAPFGVVGPKGA